MRILIVDDHPTNRELLRAQLETEGFTVLEAADGREALSVLERETIDTVISDIMRPRMDGHRFCLEVRKSERFRSIPFIVYTGTFSSPGDEKLALEMGADRYITKPASANAILDAIREVQTRPELAPVPTIENHPELALMKEYSERLVSKLEDRNIELTRLSSELQATHEQLRLLLEHSPAVIYALRVEGQNLIPYVVSENINRLLGLTVEESCSFDWWATHLHSEDRERVMAGISETIEHGALTTEHRIQHKEGHFVWVEDWRRLARNAGGHPREIAGVWDRHHRAQEGGSRISADPHGIVAIFAPGRHGGGGDERSPRRWQCPP